MQDSMHIRFKERLANITNVNPDNIQLFWKGRVGLYSILKALDIQAGDEIILPAFTCVVVVNPILYLSAKPIFVDIDPLTYTIDTSKIEAKITENTKAILAQNTYGLSSDLDAIFKLADQYGLSVIEDCAHGFGGSYKGKPNGTIAEASFMSTQWNKPFSTGLGGITISKNKVLADKMKKYETEAIHPSTYETMSLRLLYFIRKHLLTPAIYWQAIALYRWMSYHNLILGSSQGEELENTRMPDKFLKGLSSFQAKVGVKQLADFEHIVQNRKKIAAHYTKVLADLGIRSVFVPDYAEHGFLKYPLLVRDRKKFFTLAEKEKIELGDWFLSPIHPILKDFEKWQYKWGENPIAEKISRHIVNLPTDIKYESTKVDEISKFLIKHRDLIYSSVADFG